MSIKNKIRKILIATGVIYIGLLLFKYTPMSIWGKDILFDASHHLSLTILILYGIWLFISRDKSVRAGYLILSVIAVIWMGWYRIVAGAHDLIGLCLGLLISILGIWVAEKAG